MNAKSPAATPGPWSRHITPWIAILLLATLPVVAKAQSCYTGGAFGMDFGSVSINGKAATSNSLQYTCQNYSGATVYFKFCLYLGPGQFSSEQPPRRMSNHNGSFLNYDLFADPAHTQRIGSPGSSPVYVLPPMVVAQGASNTVNASIYGMVEPNQSVPADWAFQEQNIPGTIVYRFGSSPFSASAADCTAGGQGGGSMTFNSSGVTASINNTCYVTSRTDLDFGTFGNLNQIRNGTSTIQLRCPSGASWNVGLDNGSNALGTTRRMRGPSPGANNAFVTYDLYRNAARNQRWGNTIGTDTVAGSGTGSLQTLTVYGQVGVQTTPAAGSYSDTVTITLTF